MVARTAAAADRRLRRPSALAASNKTLGDLDLRRSSGVTVLALHRGDNVTLHPGATELLREGDDLIVAGLDEDLERLPSATGVAA